MKKLICFALALTMTVVLMNSCDDDDNTTKPVEKVKSFQIVSYDNVVNGYADSSEIPAAAIIKNISASSKNLMIKAEIEELAFNHVVSFCDWQNCLEVKEGTPTISGSPKVLAANESTTSGDFHLILYPANSTGTTKIKFTAYVAEDTADSVQFHITYIVN